MDSRAVDRELRATVWPALRAAGFATRTGRAAWRSRDGHLDVIEIRSVGRLADEVGCTSASFTAHLGSWPRFLRSAGVPPGAPTTGRARDGGDRPRYWECPLTLRLRKSLSQPWFVPLAGPASPPATAAARAHREALAQMLRREEHDRPEIWYVLDDGSNLRSVVADLLWVLAGRGLDTLERFHDPGAVMRMARAGELQMAPGSPAARAIVEAAEAAQRDPDGQRRLDRKRLVPGGSTDLEAR